MNVDDLLTNIPQIVGWATAVGGFLLVFWRRIVAVLRAAGLSDRLHMRFGVDPVEQLFTSIASLRRVHSEIDIRQRILAEHIQLGIYVSSPDGACTWANEVICELFGLNSEEMKGYGWLTSVKESDRRRVHEEWRYAVDQGIPYSNHYFIVVDGNEIAVESRACAAVVDGVIICYVAWVKPAPKIIPMVDPATKTGE